MYAVNSCIKRKNSALSTKMLKGKEAEGWLWTLVKKQEAKKVVNPLYEKRPKNFGNGQEDIQPKRDLTHVVKYLGYSCCSSKGLFYINV